ncbi:hypothetical protein HY732_02850 [Candidatus Uhrbacteria bacterium]|nr:hypothetical protein [Candidatus Uhrbacteria bacterium]
MAQSINDLEDRVKETKKIFKDLLAVYHTLDPQVQTQLVTGINKAYGQACAFEHEYLRAQKTLGKARALTTQTFGDVTAGEADRMFAKTSECKSVTQPDYGSVNSQIREAIKQLSGLTGSLPRADDVRIIDVYIRGDENPWPMHGGSYGTKRSSNFLDRVISKAEKVIRDLLNEPAGSSLLTWLAGQTLPTVGTLSMLKDITYDQGTYGTGLKHPSSTRPIVLTPSSTTPGSSDINKIRCLTVKIRYEYYYIVNHLGADHGLTEMVVQCFKRIGGSLTVQVVKYQMDAWDAATSAWLGVAKHYKPY